MKKVLLSLLALMVLISTACMGGPRDEKQAFIDATVEATCLVLQAENIFDPSLEEQAKDIYKKFGFDADDDQAMEALTQKYENDPEVQDAIAAAVEECAGDFFENALTDDMEEAPAADDAMMEEEPAADDTIMDEEAPADDAEEAPADDAEEAPVEEPAV